MLLHWIWLASCPNVKDWERVRLLEHFRDPEALYFADGDSLNYIEGLTREAKVSLLKKDLTQAEKILMDCSRERIHILTFQDAAYPAKLKNIPDPPVVLYYRGQLPDFDDLPVVGVVGTRKASVYGLTTAKRMGYQIAKCGGLVVSGLAAGIDAMAMSGALTAGGQTVGVLGCGADIVYPVSNRGLYQDTESCGCILTEYPPGTPPMGYNFPRRNRIISGLSNGVLVVEAPQRSGALTTARLALEQGRDVFAIPGNIDQPNCQGTNALIRDGAIVAVSAWDVMGEYAALYPDKIRRDESSPQLTAYPDEVEKQMTKAVENPPVPEKPKNLNKEFTKKVIDKEPSRTYSDVNEPLPRLTADEQTVVSAIQMGEMLVDDVIAQTGLTTGKMLAAMTMLELKGVITRLPGKRIRLGSSKEKKDT